MSDYYRHLTLPFKHDYLELTRWEVRNKKWLDYRVFPIGLLDSHLVSFMLDHGLRIMRCSAFYTPPKTLLPIHIDGFDVPNFATLNFAYGAIGSRMFWYELKPGIVAPKIVKDDSKLYGIRQEGNKVLAPIKSTNCFLRDSTNIMTPSIVNVGVPHSVLNNTSEGRWCLSLVIKSLADDFLSFNEIQTRLKEYWT